MILMQLCKTFRFQIFYKRPTQGEGMNSIVLHAV